MSTEQQIKWYKLERNKLPFGDWIQINSNDQYPSILISRNKFLEQLEIHVNN